MIARNRIDKIEKKLGLDGSINLTEIFMWVLHKKEGEQPPRHIARWFERIAEIESKKKDNQNNDAM